MKKRYFHNRKTNCLFVCSHEDDFNYYNEKETMKLNKEYVRSGIRPWTEISEEHYNYIKSLK